MTSYWDYPLFLDLCCKPILHSRITVRTSKAPWKGPGDCQICSFQSSWHSLQKEHWAGALSPKCCQVKLDAWNKESILSDQWEVGGRNQIRKTSCQTGCFPQNNNQLDCLCPIGCSAKGIPGWVGWWGSHLQPHRTSHTVSLPHSWNMESPQEGAEDGRLAVEEVILISYVHLTNISWKSSVSFAE